jgi:hypothetical protein
MVQIIDLSACFYEDADGKNAIYETTCIDNYVQSLVTLKSEVESNFDTEGESEVSDLDSVSQEL